MYVTSEAFGITVPVRVELNAPVGLLLDRIVAKAGLPKVWQWEGPIGVRFTYTPMNGQEALDRGKSLAAQNVTDRSVVWLKTRHVAILGCPADSRIGPGRDHEVFCCISARQLRFVAPRARAVPCSYSRRRPRAGSQNARQLSLEDTCPPLAGAPLPSVRRSLHGNQARRRILSPVRVQKPDFAPPLQRKWAIQRLDFRSCDSLIGPEAAYSWPNLGISG